MTWTEILEPMAIPLAIVVVGLFCLWRVQEQVKPIMVGVVKGLAEGSNKDPIFYAMALMYASAAGLQALAEEAAKLHWVYVVAFAKVAQPGVVAIIAYVNKPPSPSIADQVAPAIKVIPAAPAAVVSQPSNVSPS